MDVDGSCTDGDDDWGHYGTSYTAALLVKEDDGEYSIGGTNYKLELTSAPFTYPEGMEYGDIDTLKVIVTDPMAGEITLHVQADHVPTEDESDWIAIYKKDDLVEAFPTKNKWSPNPSVAGTFKNTYINGEVPSCVDSCSDTCEGGIADHVSDDACDAPGVRCRSATSAPTAPTAATPASPRRSRARWCSASTGPRVPP